MTARIPLQRTLCLRQVKAPFLIILWAGILLFVLVIYSHVRLSQYPSSRLQRQGLSLHSFPRDAMSRYVEEDSVARVSAREASSDSQMVGRVSARESFPDSQMIDRVSARESFPDSQMIGRVSARKSSPDINMTGRVADTKSSWPDIQMEGRVSGTKSFPGSHIEGRDSSRKSSSDSQMIGRVSARKFSPDSQMIGRVSARKLSPDSQIVDRVSARKFSPDSQMIGRVSARKFSPDSQMEGRVSGTKSFLNFNKPWCPDPPIVKEEDANVTLNLNEVSYAELVKEFADVMQFGGHYAPPTCRSREHVALIIPYRDREHNLHVLLHNLLPFLMRQQLEFSVFLGEQTAEHPFNKGLIFNVAYKYSLKTGANFTCFIMQDTDLIPMDNRNLYRCADQPRHLVLTWGQTKWKNSLLYDTLFGGAIAMRRKHFEAANGFPVSFYGWGLEDDDLYLRFVKQNFTVVRYPILIGRYYELRHTHQARNPERQLMNDTMLQRQKIDGLNSMRYNLTRAQRRPLFTHLLVQVPPPPPHIYGRWHFERLLWSPFAPCVFLMGLLLWCLCKYKLHHKARDRIIY